MKKILSSFLLLLVAVAFMSSNKTWAGGPIDVAFALSPSSTTALADGQAAITMTVHTYYYQCSGPDEYGSYRSSSDPNFCSSHGYGTAIKQDKSMSGLSVVVSGSGNTVTPTTFSTDGSGHASFIIKSTTAETKTVTIFAYNGNYEYAHTTVTFTAPAPVATAPKKTPVPAPAPTPAPTTTPAAPVPPTVPTLAAIQVGSQKIDSTKPIVFDQSKPFVLSGSTVPNGLVTLTIHSTPKTVTTTADKDGRWSYTVAGLEVGDHYIEAAVTDPTTNKTSDTAKLISFTLTAARKSPVTQTAEVPKRQSNTLLILGLVGVALIIGGGGWLFWRRRVRKNIADGSDKLS